MDRRYCIRMSSSNFGYFKTDLFCHPGYTGAVQTSDYTHYVMFSRNIFRIEPLNNVANFEEPFQLNAESPPYSPNSCEKDSTLLIRINDKDKAPH